MKHHIIDHPPFSLINERESNRTNRLPLFTDRYKFRLRVKFDHFLCWPVAILMLALLY